MARLILDFLALGVADWPYLHRPGAVTGWRMRFKVGNGPELMLLCRFWNQGKRKRSSYGKRPR